ncbi:MAG: ABC transporter substrate-binding protein [Anaerolineaceae bacterium]|jgi:peptide/nickel transport system substrate-binding protein|nr:ABC transporter substrate-binding protein [Anaerolineaceae bacterium]
MKRSKAILTLLVFSLLLAACGSNQPEISDIPTQSPIAQTATLAPTATATEIPPLVLNICMAEEPAGLYRYDGVENRAKQSVYAAIYVDLLETAEGTNQSLFFESVPTEENSGIVVQPVTVKVGQPILDAAGKVVYLAEGTKIEHAINYSIENPVEWNFEQEYQMNQFTVTFKLLPDLKWSDGEPLVANDFVFSYQLAERSGLGHYQWALERTDSFIAVDERTLVWTGIPGFVPHDLQAVLWKPMPTHQLGELSDTELLTADITTRVPAGWGAYRLVSWDAGSQIVLEKNPNFVISEQMLPAYDQLIFQIEPGLDAALQKLETGQCDVLDMTYRLEAMEKSQLDSFAEQNILIAENWEPVQQLVFGIQPAAYDDGLYSQWTSERQDILSSQQTRKALAACLEPDTLVREYLADHLPETVLVGLENQEKSILDPNQALDEIGWMITEASQAGVRVAQVVDNVLDGTELRLGLLIGQSRMDQDIAGMVAQRLAGCGVAVDVQALPLSELYRPGPDGLLFGRNFELALVSWQPENANYCQFYTSDQIPSSINSWVGTNLAGLHNEAFDETCWGISTWLPDEQRMNDSELMAEYLPAIPLMPQYRLWVSSGRVNLPQSASFTDLWKFTPIQ